MKLFPKLSGTPKPSPALAVPGCSDFSPMSSGYDSSHGSSSYESYSYDSDYEYGGSTSSGSGPSDSSSSDGEGLANYHTAKRQLFLRSTWWFYLALTPLPPIPFLCPRYDKALPIPKLKRRHQQHLQGWGMDMRQRGGLGISTHFHVGSKCHRW